MTTRAAPLVVPLSQGAVARVRVAAVVRFGLIGLLIGNLGRIPAFSTGGRDAAILINDVLVAAAIVAGALQAIRTRRLRLDSVSILALLFAGIGGASTLLSIPRFGLSSFEVGVSLGYLARWLYYFAIYVVLVNAMRDGDAETMWRSLETVILIFAAFGIIQSLTLPNFAQIVYPSSRLGDDWDPQGHRLVSTWLDPVFAGAFIMVGLLVQLSMIASGRRVAAWKTVVLSAALLMTASRGALLATAVGLVVIVGARGLSRRMLRAGLSVVAIVAVGVPVMLRFTGLSEKLGVDVSAMQRVVAWLRAYQVFRDHPLIGIGFNAWGFVQERYGYVRYHAFSYSLDGGLIFIAVMTGVVGLAIYVGMLGVVIGRARRVWRAATAEPLQRGLAIGVGASTVALVVDSLFGNALMLPFLMESMWILWAIVFGLERSRQLVTNAARR